MSRIGKKPIEIPKGVNVSLEEMTLTVEGPKGRLSRSIPPELTCRVEGDRIFCSRSSDIPRIRALHGLIRTKINNMILGVTSAFSKTLDIVGVGYKAEVSGKELILNVGYTNPVRFPVPEGIKVQVEKNTRIIVSGVDKELVGETSANIRKIRPPDNYKGKGIRYMGERIIIKPGKAVTTAGATGSK